MTFMLSVSPEDIALIGEGLGELKFSRVNALLAKLQKQISDQQTDMTQTPEDKPSRSKAIPK